MKLTLLIEIGNRNLPIPLAEKNEKCRSSQPEMFCKKVVLRNLTKFTGKHLCQSFFLHRTPLVTASEDDFKEN